MATRFNYQVSFEFIKHEQSSCGPEKYVGWQATATVVVLKYVHVYPNV